MKPLKIKKAAIGGNVSTPSPMLQRESREWKPSSQFFKPLNAGMHLSTQGPLITDGRNSCKWTYHYEVLEIKPCGLGSRIRDMEAEWRLKVITDLISW